MDFADTQQCTYDFPVINYLSRCCLFVVIFSATAHSVSGPPGSYVTFSGPLPIPYKLDAATPGAYITLHRQGSATELAKQNAQQGVTDGE